MVRVKKTPVSNGGESRAGEKRVNPKNKKLRELEYTKTNSKEKRVAGNIEHEKDGLYECEL